MITKLNLKQFRNHKLLELPIKSNLVAITGPNASGKTNILESIYISSISKSFRSSDAKLITYGEEFFTIDRYEDDVNIHIRYTTTNGSGSKKIRYQNKYIPLKDMIGKNPVVLFEPKELDLLIGLPAIRRRYLDQLLSQTDPKYLSNLKSYKKLLTSRNSLLRRSKKQTIHNLGELLFILNIQIVEPAMYLIQARKKLINDIQEIITSHYTNISKTKTDIVINYQPSAESEDQLISMIEQNTSRDMVVGYSSVGPHREDFKVMFNSHNIEDNASRGEVRSLVLAFKLSELEYIQKVLHKRPTLLLDDVLSELDDNRQTYLLNNLSSQQTFITTTHLPVKIKPNFQHIELPL